MVDINEPVIWIKNPAAVFAQNCEGGVVIQGQKIIEIVKLGQSPKTQIDDTYDASESVLLPGLINTHHHFYQTLTRAYPEALNKELFPWLKSLYKVWANIQPEMLAVSTELALSELLLSGCTTASDHHYLIPSQLRKCYRYTGGRGSKARYARCFNERLDESWRKRWWPSTAICCSDQRADTV